MSELGIEAVQQVLDNRRTRARNQLVLAASALVAAGAVSHARLFFTLISAFGVGAAVCFHIAAEVAREDRDLRLDLLVATSQSGAEGRRAWPEEARTQRHLAHRLRRLCRASRSASGMFPTVHNGPTVRAFEPRLAALADRFERDAGHIPAPVVAHVRLLLSDVGPLIVDKPDLITSQRARRETDRALGWIEDELDRDRHRAA